jgi:hypothetical protein
MIVSPGQPIAPAAPAAKPARQSGLWNAGGPAGLAALEARNAAARQDQLRHAPRDAAAERSDVEKFGGAAEGAVIRVPRAALAPSPFRFGL